MANNSFSNKMSSWLSSPSRKNLSDLESVFGTKSFAVAFMILLAPAALPIPTGGITHLFEVIAALLVLEMIFGLKSIWLPRKWRKVELGQTITTKVLPKFIGFIRWFEKRSNPRWSALMRQDLLIRVVGIIILILTVAAFLAPPFSGLDTLPAMGVVVISLALLLEDALLLVVGAGIGAGGIVAELTLGSLVWGFLT